MSNHNKFSRLFIFILFLSVFLEASGQVTKVESELQTMMKELNAVGLSVAVVKDGDIIYTHSFGLKDIENNTALTDQNIFRIASISKSFSATSIMQLAEAKKLSLDDDFSNLVGFKIRKG